MKPMKLQKNSLSEFGQSDPYRIQPSCQGRKISSPLSAHSKARHVTAIIPKQLNNNQYLIYSSTDLLIRTAGAIVLAKHPLKYSGALNRVLNRRLQSRMFDDFVDFLYVARHSSHQPVTNLGQEMPPSLSFQPLDSSINRILIVTRVSRGSI
jgi:hypothetical protein